MTRWPEAKARLAGRHATLEPLGEEHAGELFLAAQDERIWQWLGGRVPDTPQRFAAWFGEAMAAAKRGEEVPFAVRHAGRVVGSTRFMGLAPEHGRLEVGWTWYEPAVWGTGVNVECKLLLFGHAFERLRCSRVELKTDARNERSRAAMLKLGAQFEGIHRKHMRVPNGPRDTAWYSVVDDEWPTVKARLEERLRRY